MRPPSEQDRIPRTGNRGTAERRTLSDRLPHPWAFPLLVFAAAWLLILAAWYGSDAVYGRSHRWTWHFLIKDANFYLGILNYSAGFRRPTAFLRRNEYATYI